VIARQKGRGLADLAAEAGTPLVAGSSLKAALDLDWDDPAAHDQALSLGATNYAAPKARRSMRPPSAAASLRTKSLAMMRMMLSGLMNWPAGVAPL